MKGGGKHVRRKAKNLLGASEMMVSPGNLKVKICSASGMPTNGYFGAKPEVYMVCTINEIVQKTELAPKSCSPTFNETFSAKLAPGMKLEHCTVDIDVFDASISTCERSKKNVSGHRFLGSYHATGALLYTLIASTKELEAKQKEEEDKAEARDKHKIVEEEEKENDEEEKILTKKKSLITSTLSLLSLVDSAGPKAHPGVNVKLTDNIMYSSTSAITVKGEISITIEYLPPISFESLHVDKAQQQEKQKLDFDILEISILSARNLSRVDVLGMCDAYAVVYFNDSPAGTTPVVFNTLYPRWGADLAAMSTSSRDAVHQRQDRQKITDSTSTTTSTFVVPFPRQLLLTKPANVDGHVNDAHSVFMESCNLRIELFDKNELKGDVFIGCVILKGDDLLQFFGNPTYMRQPSPEPVELSSERQSGHEHHDESKHDRIEHALALAAMQGDRHHKHHHHHKHAHTHIVKHFVNSLPIWVALGPSPVRYVLLS